MQHKFGTHSLREIADADRLGMFRLRYDTFFTRLAWDVETTDDGQEIDQYDKDDRSKYILGKSALGAVDACWRLRPTLGPNMLRDVFPFLLHGQPAPEAADVWEVSRVAIATDRLSASEDAGKHQIGFGRLSIALLQESVKFARESGIARYVTVTTTAIERMFKRQNVNIHRLGPPMKIGQVMTVACLIEIDDVTAKALRM